MKKHNRNHGIGSITAGVVGAAVGATAVVLSQKNNRKKAGKMIANAKNTGEQLKERVEEMWNKDEKDVKKAKTLR